MPLATSWNDICKCYTLSSLQSVEEEKGEEGEEREEGEEEEEEKEKKERRRRRRRRRKKRKGKKNSIPPSHKMKLGERLIMCFSCSLLKSEAVSV